MFWKQCGIFTPHDQGFFTPWMVILAFVYRFTYTVIGGYVTAILAPSRPMRHAIILGIVGTVLGTIGVFVAWDLSSALVSDCLGGYRNTFYMVRRKIENKLNESTKQYSHVKNQTKDHSIFMVR